MKTLSLTLCLLSLLLPLYASAIDSTACTPIIGFGRNVTGGEGKPIFTVTNLNDSGPGSFRDALGDAPEGTLQNDRDVRFAVSGTINLQSRIRLDGRSNITIDGFSAPAPGITIDGGGAGSSADAIILTNSNNIIVRGIRIQNAGNDNLQITTSSNLVITHNSFINAGDGAIDITQGVTDITVSWNIVADTAVASLIKYDNPRRFTIHNNLYTRNNERNPLIEDVTDFDYFNNVIYDWGDSGTQVRNGSTGNAIGNYFSPTARQHASLWVGDQGHPGDVTPGPFYLAGYRPEVDNSSVDPFPNVLPVENWTRTVTEDWARFMVNTPFDYGYPVTYTTAEQAVLDVLSFVGPKDRTTQEDNYINEVISATGIDPGTVVCVNPVIFSDSFEGSAT